MNTVTPEYRSPDLTQYKLAAEHDIRCPKCRAGSNYISCTWTRGRVELKCLCGSLWELFIDARSKVGRAKKQRSQTPRMPKIDAQ